MLILGKILYDKEQKHQTKMWGVHLTSERKSKEKHWWSVEGWNRTSLQACGSICNKRKL